MAYTEGLCSAIQVNLNDIAGSNAPALRRDKVGMVDALMSEANRSGFTAQVVPTNGKFRAVQINYQNQACDSDVVTSCASNCTPEVAPEPKEALITEFNCLKYKMTFDENEMRKLCEADTVWVGQTIMNAMNAVNIALDKALLTAYNAQAGKWIDDSGSPQAAPINVPLFNASGQVNPMSWAYIKHIYENWGLSGLPFIVGGGSIDLWAKAQSIACCNTNYGMDLGRGVGETMFYTDRFSSSILGDGDGTGAAFFAPGTVQLITWNKYLGDYAKRNDSFEHGTVVDPFSGLLYDLKTNYDDCTENWYIELALNYAPFFMPEGFCAGPGVNGTTLIKDCSAGGDVSCPA
jgi:hypothetical protein